MLPIPQETLDKQATGAAAGIIALTHLVLLVSTVRKRYLAEINCFLEHIGPRMGFVYFILVRGLYRPFRMDLLLCPAFLVVSAMLFFTAGVPRFLILFLGFSPIMLLGLPALGNSSDKDFARMHYSHILFTLNVTLLGISVCPFLLAFFFAELNNVTQRLGLALGTDALSFLLVFLTVALYCFPLSQLAAPGHDIAKQTATIRQRYRDFPSNITIASREERADAYLKLYSTVLVGWFLSMWLILVYQMVGAITSIRTGERLPMTVLNGETLQMMADALCLDQSIHMDMGLLYLYLFGPVTGAVALYAVAAAVNVRNGRVKQSRRTFRSKELQTLQSLVEQMLEGTNLTPQLELYESDEVNGFVCPNVLFDRRRVRIFLSTRALQELDHRRLVYLLAHEVGHLHSISAWQIALVSKVMKLVIGGPGLLALFFDVPEEERKADRSAARFIYRLEGSDGVERYCDFLEELSAINAVGVYLPRQPLVQRMVSVLESDTVRQEGRGKLKRLPTICRILSNINVFVNIALLNRSVLFVHPTAGNRGKAVRSFLSSIETA